MRRATGSGLMLSLSWARAIKSWFSGSGEMINNSDSAVSVSRPRRVYLACSVCSAAAGSIPAGVSWAACCSVQAGVCSLMLQCCSHRPLPAPGLQGALQCLPWAGAMVCWREGSMRSEPSRWINGSTFALSQTETFIDVQIPTTVDCFDVPWYLTFKKSFWFW